MSVLELCILAGAGIALVLAAGACGAAVVLVLYADQ